MSPADKMKPGALSLRQRAEAVARHVLSEESRSDRFLSAEESRTLLHELRVHQIELEMQNETLRQGQVALEESRDRYLDLYDFAPLGYLSLNAEGMIEEINLTAVALLGGERQKLLRRSLTSLVLAEDQPRWLALFMTVQQQGGKGTVDVAVQRGDGTLFQAQIDCGRQEAGDGALRVALSDISRRKQAEQTLRSSEALFRTMFEQSDLVMLLIEPDSGAIVDANAAAVRFYGYAIEDFKALHIHQIITLPADEVAGRLLKAARGDQNAFVFAHRLAGGKVRAVEVHASRIEVGGRILIFSIIQDVSEKERQRAELDAYRNNLEALVAARTAELEAANRRLGKNDQRLSAMFAMSQRAHDLDEGEILQLAVEEAVRLTSSEIGYIHFVNDDRETLSLGTWSQGTLQHCTAAHDNHYPVSAAGVWADTVRLRRPVIHNDYQGLPGRRGYPQGHAHLLRHLGVPVMAGDEVRLLMGVGNKAGDYDEADTNDLHLIGNDVWSIITRRRAELKLADARQAAEAANIAKSAFLANMSHEIRTPMNGILGMANILRREGVSPRQAQRLDTIDTSARHLLSIINNILDLSKIEAGKFTLETAPVAIDSLLANVSLILSERARTKGIHLLIDTGALPQNLTGDPTRLQQALLNYAGNAIKFTEQGSVTLRAIKQEESDADVVVRFEVEDTGIGISAEAMPRLFSAFEQADNSMSRQYGGTGLGLAITKRLAELMGGAAGAESTPGAGSTFWFTARLKKGMQAAAGVAATEVDAESELRRRDAGRRVLVVDDEPVNREVAQIQLESADLVADMAADGAEAVAMAQQKVYAAILMDMQMPQVSGLEATRRGCARHCSTTPAMPSS
ncbi:MAG: ATP-binding protein, partial [Rhodocyclales bacterium]|nr:ATP-binding protein [Rhodocyclales bacterium]